jgi:hypothetical protein
MLTGAISGVVIAFAFMAWFGGWTSIETVDAVAGLTGTAGATPVFVTDADAMWLLTLFLGAVGGMVVAGVSYAGERALEPDAPAYQLGWLIPIGLVLGSVMAYSVVRLGVTIGGETDGSNVVVPAATFVLVAALAGLAGGMVIAPIVAALARPANIGPRNEATPVSSKAFWLDTMGAVGLPTLAAIIIAFLAISLAQLLLSAESTVVAVTAFSVVAALILGGTTLFALRPWDRS